MLYDYMIKKWCVVQRSKSKDLCEQKGLGAQVGVNFDQIKYYSVVRKCLLGNVIACRGSIQ